MRVTVMWRDDTMRGEDFRTCIVEFHGAQGELMRREPGAVRQVLRYAMRGCAYEDETVHRLMAQGAAELVAAVLGEGVFI